MQSSQSILHLAHGNQVIIENECQRTANCKSRQKHAKSPRTDLESPCQVQSRKLTRVVHWKTNLTETSPQSITFLPDKRD
jgi:hypothetical protein